MSFDLAVFFADRRFDDAEAAGVYGRLCEGVYDDVRPDARIDAFYEELSTLHPEIDDVPEDRLDDVDYCP